jgi:hypothetical protein
MNRNIILTSLALALTFASCQPSEDEKAAPAMRRIDSLFAAHDYPATLRAVSALRRDHPKAIESRKKALKIWQEASLKMTQDDIGKTDSALQATLAQMHAATQLGERNRLKVKADSLQVRYDALCGTVRVIRKRQQE